MTALTEIRPASGNGTRYLLLAGYLLLFATIAYAVIFPIFCLVQTSLHVGALGTGEQFGFDNWIEPFRNRRLVEALWNTASLSVTRQLISLFVGVAIAWLIARTNLPARNWLEVGFWIALFMPALPVAMSWVLLAGGRNGILNLWAADLLPFLEGPIFNIYSWWGIVWVHLITATIPIKVFFLAPALRNMDAALEESARTSGSGLIGTLWRIVIPIMLAPIVVVTLLGLIRSMQAFEIELILGTPAGIDVYSTVIYRAMRQEPPLHGVASALSLLFIMIVIPLVLLQQYLVKKQGHAVIRGRISTRTQDLGKWRWPLFTAVVLLLLTMTVLPMVMLLVGSFMKIFGAFDLPGVWTTRHWHEAFTRPELVRALSNTLQLGAGAALIGMGLYTVIAYIIVKTQLVGRRAFDILTWLPTVVPGIVLSLGLLQMVLQTSALRAIYGTTWILILAVLIGNLTVGVQVIRTTLLQLTAELEEASWTSGGGRLRTFFRIALPITAPSIIIVGLEVFATAVSIVSVVVLLGTGPIQPLSILQLAYLDSGQFESATIVGLLIMVISITAAILARFVSARFGLSRD